MWKIAIKQIKRETFWWVVVGALVVIISIFHYTTPISAGRYHLFYMQSYFIPILIAAFQFGIRGGLGTAVAISIVYFPHITLQWVGNFEHNLLQFLQIVMYNVIGYLTGLKAQSEQLEKNRYQLAARELEKSLAKLKNQSEKLSELEDQLRQMDRLAIVGELTASLAHEVRNPLGSILGAVEILKDELPPAAQKTEFFQILIEETDRLNAVVENYLNFSKKQAQAVVKFNLQEVVQSAVTMISARARKSLVKMELNLPKTPVTIKGDPNQLRQVLINLLLNAIQAMPGSGSVRLSGMIFQPDLEQNSGPLSENHTILELSVRDEGTGIPAENLDRIFSPFYTTKADGTGLGLSIVKRIADENKWQLNVESEINNGAEFKIRIPLKEDLVYESKN